MNLKIYLAELGRGGATKIAAELSVSLSYLSQLASGKTPISPIRCVEIEKVTGGVVTRQDLRPSDWHLIWPELIALANFTPCTRPNFSPGDDLPTRRNVMEFGSAQPQLLDKPK